MPRIDVPDGKADPEVRVWALRPEMGMAAGALSHAIYEQSIVPVRERELARIRIAQINGCAICLTWRKTAGAAEVMTEADYAHVAEWATHADYTERERLAIEYAEKFALDTRSTRRRVLRAPARRVQRSRDPRPDGLHRRLARARTHAARARHRRHLPHPRAHRSVASDRATLEDRRTPGLYLEMTDRALDAYARERVPEVLALPGVQRATWWRNVHRDRDDLPRVLPEFDHLGVYEVDDAFVPPETPADIAGHHFRRTPRPVKASSPATRRSACRSC